MNTKLIAIVAAASAVVSAQAVSINFQSRGTVSGAGTYSVLDTSLTQYLPGSTAGYNFVSLSYSVTPTFVGTSTVGTVSGSGVLNITDPSNDPVAVSFEFSGAASRPSGSSLNLFSYANLPMSLSAIIDGVQHVGTGSFSTNKFNSVSRDTFIATLNPVPEPASMAAIAIGGLGLFRRRRKA